MTETILSEWTDPSVLPAADAAALLADASWTRMVTIGDSVAEGVREPVPGYRDLSWTDRVEEALRAATPGFTALNLGRRGLVAAEVAAGQLRPALEFGPDLAFVVAGGNDMLRPHFDEDEVRRELASMVSAFRAAGADVVTIGLLDITAAGLSPSSSPHPPPIKGRAPLGAARYHEVMSARTRRLAALTAEVAAEHGACHVDNPRGHPVAADPGIYSGDQLHLNARGHAFAAANTVRALAAHLASA
ncbi:SGNH/GDSL hydrolase family protein [Actinomadura darangshiensis]|uniref:SGNH/GDSL hydrolase family protein n=1 Tax=Actinomadura darangshiensis TaxID=705336 RepID=A0A4R5B9C9_9ACTN|nr:SGNH/GDSL hydrolase family protein [Actinomadura darangshiensis]TDD82085.1 SGNH/GDSL hydrolase family protein [Actinomadura darangshiensis]